MSPEPQILETEIKQLLHGFRMIAYNIMMMLVAEIRTNTGYKDSQSKAHNLGRQFLKHSADLDPRQCGYLDVALDPMPTKHETVALSELCTQLTDTQIRYPGTKRDLLEKNHGLLKNRFDTDTPIPGRFTVTTPKVEEPVKFAEGALTMNIVKAPSETD